MNKKILTFILILLSLAVLVWAADVTYQTKVYVKQGGDEQVIASGGKQTVESGGIVDFESGSSFKIAGTAVTATAAEVNKLSGATVTVTEINKLAGATGSLLTTTSTGEEKIPLPIGAFIGSYVTGYTAAAFVLTAATDPGIGVAALIPGIYWADNSISPVAITFRVPANYSSGGAFRLICTETDSTTPNQVDFDVWVNKSGTAFDSTATGQTPVALTKDTTTPSVVTLTPATDFAALVAGDWVTLRMWRDNVATGTGTLYVHGVDFFYTGTK